MTTSDKPQSKEEQGVKVFTQTFDQVKQGSIDGIKSLDDLVLVGGVETYGTNDEGRMDILSGMKNDLRKQARELNASYIFGVRYTVSGPNKYNQAVFLAYGDAYKLKEQEPLNPPLV